MLGSSIAMVATGPRPGSTPIRVPRTAPPKAYSRLVRVKAVWKPSARLFSRSMSVCSSGARQQRDRQAQALDEHDPGQKGQDHGVEGRAFPGEFVAGQAG